MTYSSNSKAQIERLAMLVEETSEMSRAAMRVLRFGGASKPTQSDIDNREALSRKVGNTLEMLDEMRAAGDFTETGVAFGANKRRLHKPFYTTHQPYSVSRSAAKPALDDVEEEEHGSHPEQGA